MSLSTFKFALLAIGAIFMASTDAEMVQAQVAARFTQRQDQLLNKIQMPEEKRIGQIDSQPPRIDDSAAEKIAAVAKTIGLDGRWIVLKVDKDGELTKAQIGQKPNDVISIVPGEDGGGPLALG